MVKKIPGFSRKTINKLLIVFSALQLYCYLLPAQTPTEILKTQAQDHMNVGNFGEAINLLNSYISSNPRDPEGYNLRGVCFENRKEYEKSVYDFRFALKLKPGDESISFNLDRAVHKWETLLYNRIVGYKREIEINPGKPVNFLEVGRCFKNLGNWQEAESWYDEYLRREEPSADELIRYTEILARNNHISKGEPWLKKFTGKFPEDHRLWSRYGYFLMWLGKKQESIIAFERALNLRPYFKEALDGYDLARGKGYVYTVNDTTVRYNFGMPVTVASDEFPIDKFYKKLVRNEYDLQTRILLIKELIKFNRYAEAEKQLQILINYQVKDEQVETLMNELSIKKESYLWQRASELESSLIENPSDEKNTIELAHIYAEQKHFDRALTLMNGFKEKYSSGEPVLYTLALINSWAGNLNTAYNNCKSLLDINPANLDYQLLYGQLSVWLDKNLETAQVYLENVLRQSPDNFDVLIALSSLHMQNNEFDKAVYYLQQASELRAENPEVKKLSHSIKQRKIINEQQELFNLLDEARKSLFNKECERSIELFSRYLKSENSNPEIKKELADAYLCKGDYQTAINILDELILINPDDLGLLKTKAKLMYWSGDYQQAKKEFFNLSLINPDDAEVKLFLGDSYAALDDFNGAKEVYKALLEISPSSFILKKRMSWIEGPEYSGFPVSYMLLPEVYFYADNFDFLYSTYGLRFDLGVTNFLTLGAAGYGGVLSSDSISNNISIIKGIISSRLSSIVNAQASFGSTFFPEKQNSLLAEVSIKVETAGIYYFSAGFYSMDAAQLLYSPYLVDKRLRSNALSLQGDYIISDSWKFSGIYSFYSISDENIANKLQLRMGKIFSKTIVAGIEYFYYDAKDSTALYWSPSAFDSYSLWADWNIVNNKDVNAKIGAKLGYIPSDEFILREFFGSARFRITDSFYLQASFGLSSTIQSGAGYSSTSLGMSAFWSF